MNTASYKTILQNKLMTMFNIINMDKNNFYELRICEKYYFIMNYREVIKK